MIVYISGPMTGYTDLNFPAFQAAAVLLTSVGHEVVNPAALHTLVADAPWSYYLRRDIVAMMDCSNILMLPGWMDSKGARLERHIGVQLGMQIHYRIDELLTVTKEVEA